MCEESATAENVRAAMPHPVPGSAVDPIALKPVDEVVVTTLVDNVYDALLMGDDTITRAPRQVQGPPRHPNSSRGYQGRADGRARLLRAGQCLSRETPEPVARRSRVFWRDFL